MALPSPPYYYQAIRTWDLVLNRALGSATVQFYAEGDSAYSTPLTIWDFAGTSLGASLTSTAAGDVGPYVLAVPRAVAKSGDWTTPVASYKGIEDAVTTAKDAAVAAQAAAESANTLPAGGTTGQYVAKASNADYDYTYVDPAVAGGGGHVIKDEGSTLTQRAALNFVGSTVTVTDNAGAGATVVTVSAAPDSIMTGADPDLDTFAKVAAALANDATFATVATALAGKAATTQTPPIYVPTTLPLPSRSSVIPAGYTGVVGLITTLVPSITDAAILAFLTVDGDFVLELAP